MFFLLLLFSSPLIAQQSYEDQFWDLVASFELNIRDKEVSTMNIEKLTKIVDKFESPLARKELILRNVQYIKIYSNTEKLRNYLELNLDSISKSHYDYLTLYVDLIMLLESTGDTEKVLAMKKNLSNLPNKYAKSFYLALDLYLTKKTSAFEKLKEHCFDGCNFSLYHLSILKYLKNQKNNKLLHSYSENLFKKLYEKTLFVDDIFFSNYLMAYMSVSFSIFNEKDSADLFREEAFLGIENRSFVYMMLKNITEISKR